MEGNMNNNMSNFSHLNQSDHHDDDQQQPEQQPPLPPAKKKRSLPGNPDPDAEVIAMSPKSLLASNRFVCEICNKGFQRDQNLQLHRRGHNLPWKLKQRTNKDVIRKKVYVCPEPSCVHHHPSRALGDLTGIKKHFFRKHGEKKWKCDKCSKRYAVQSDWKAHSKICGTREYRCDCGTLFSRRDSFITHRAFCDALAEETARSVTRNSLISNPSSVFGGSQSSTSHFINTNLQQQQTALQFNTNTQQNHDNNNNSNNNLVHSLKREQQTSAIDQHHQHLMISSSLSPSSSSSSLIFHHQDSHHQLNHYHHQQEILNPSNGSSSIGGPTSIGLSGAHMSATALLQKAAEMGATMSKTAGGSSPNNQQHHYHQQGHVTDTNSNTTTVAAGLFGLNLPSRDHQHHHHRQELLASNNSITTTDGLILNHYLSPFGNKAAAKTETTTTTTAGTTVSGSDQQQFTGASSSSSFLHDMIISSYDHDDAFGKHEFQTFHRTLGRFPNCDNINGGRGNDGLTRDFLGLRPLSHNEMVTFAGLGNCMSTNTNPNSDDHRPQQDHHNTRWQG